MAHDSFKTKPYDSTLPSKYYLCRPEIIEPENNENFPKYLKMAEFYIWHFNCVLMIMALKFFPFSHCKYKQYFMQHKLTPFYAMNFVNIHRRLLCLFKYKLQWKDEGKAPKCHLPLNWILILFENFHQLGNHHTCLTRTNSNYQIIICHA